MSDLTPEQQEAIDQGRAGLFFVPEKMEFGPDDDEEDEDDPFTLALIEHMSKPIDPNWPPCPYGHPRDDFPNSFCTCWSLPVQPD